MNHIQTFRDAQLSRWQSVVDETFAVGAPANDAVVVSTAGHVASQPSSDDAVARDPGHPAAEAAAMVAAEAIDPDSSIAPPLSAGMQVDLALPTMAPVVECARRAYRLLRAKLARADPATIERLEDDLNDSICDPRWLESVTEYIKRFGVEHVTIPYRPAPASPEALPPLVLRENATIALVADWGTGTQEAFRVLLQIATHQPDVVIHLGDIYYSGTAYENQHYFFEACNRILNRRGGHAVPVFTLAGNHDMYSGGAPYYALIDALNAPPLAPAGQLQQRSFFGLRSSGWQLLAMDTGLNDHDVLAVNTAMPGLEELEAAWHRYWIANAGGRRTILLSHHPLFSAFSPIGGDANAPRSTNTALAVQFRDVLANVDAWFWGHEHNLAMYEPYLGLQRGRLIGHGGVPVFTSQNPYTPRVTDIKVLPEQLDTEDDVYRHGFVILQLDDASRTARASYYQDADERPLLYSEVIG